MDDEVKKYAEVLAKRRENVPIWERKTMSVEEAAAYSGIGENRLRNLTLMKQCPFIVVNGTKVCIVRKKFDDFLSKTKKI